MANIRAIIFDWARTVYAPDAEVEFPEAEEILKYCEGKEYRLAVVSLITHAPLAVREKELKASPLRQYFEMALATDKDKDELFEQVVEHLGLPREEILIVDDRTVRGIRYGNTHGHPTVWLQKGKYANELPNASTGQPTYTIHQLNELKSIL